jgi:hypothetical protein
MIRSVRVAVAFASSPSFAVPGRLDVVAVLASNAVHHHAVVPVSCHAARHVPVITNPANCRYFRRFAAKLACHATIFA